MAMYGTTFQVPNDSSSSMGLYAQAPAASSGSTREGTVVSGLNPARRWRARGHQSAGWRAWWSAQDDRKIPMEVKQTQELPPFMVGG